jgi:hypothetical protein
MLKCLSEHCVCAPHSLSAGTSTTPRQSVSFSCPPFDLSFVCEFAVAVTRVVGREKEHSASGYEPAETPPISRLDEFQQIAVDLVLLGRAHAARASTVDSSAWRF